MGDTLQERIEKQQLRNKNKVLEAEVKFLKSKVEFLKQEILFYKQKYKGKNNSEDISIQDALNYLDETYEKIKRELFASFQLFK